MLYRTLLILITFLLAHPLLAVTLTKTPGEIGQTLYKVEHPRYRLAFVSDPGGWCVDFHFPKDGPDWIPEGAEYKDGGNLFVHTISGEGIDNKHTKAPRRIEVVEETPERLQLRFSTELSGIPNIIHTMTFADNTSAIRVDLELRNDGARPLLAGLWPHHHFLADGKLLRSTFFRPGPHGVVSIGFIPPADGSEVDTQTLATQARTGISNDFLRKPTEGWTATMNQRSRRGMVFVMDYNNLSTLYNCIPYSTTEWFYDKTPVSSGKSWTTTYWAIPVDGIATVAHASERLICALGVQREGEHAVLAGDLLRATKAPQSLQLTIAYRLLFGDTEFKPLPAPEIGTLTDEATSFSVSLPSAPPDKSLVFNLTFSGTDAAGQPFSETTEWLSADKDAVSFDLIAGTSIHHFNRVPPPKHKIFEKPKHMRLETQVGCPMLELRGPAFYRTGLTTAATLAGIYEIRGSYMQQSFDGFSVDVFPATYDALFEYNLLALNNVPVEVLQPYAQEMVKDFVEAGGGLVIVGGSDSLSRGGYHQGPISTLLPVRLSGEPFAWKRLPAGTARKISRAAGARILKDVDIPDGMECEWAEPVEVAEGAWAELMVGDLPFIVCSEVKGRTYTGRVAVIAGSAFGIAENGFWCHRDWPYVLAKVIDWVNHEAHIEEPDFVPSRSGHAVSGRLQHD